LRQDVFVRIVDGFLTAVAVLSLGSLAALTFGLLLALLSYLGGSLVDKVVSFLADALYSIPSILIALAVMIGTPSDSVNRYWIVIGSASLGVMLFFGAKLYRTLRVNMALTQMSGFHVGARALGLGRFRIFFKHLLPNSLTGLGPLLTGAGSDAILTLAGLGFIGVGISATDGADWGYDLSRGIQDISQGIWWTTAFPALAMSLTVLAFAISFERWKPNAQA
jgi:peptide/nickel transport system permease protein